MRFIEIENLKRNIEHPQVNSEIIINQKLYRNEHSKNVIKEAQRNKSFVKAIAT